MIICLIEFKTIPGMEDEQQKWLADLMPIVEKMPGFLGKESYLHISGDGRTNTVSFWKDERSLLAWTRESRHKEAMEAGRNTIFSWYQIRICSEIRNYEYSLKH